MASGIRLLAIALAAAAGAGAASAQTAPPASSPGQTVIVTTPHPEAAKPAAPKPALSTRPPIEPQYREAAAKRAAERQRIANCQRAATVAKITVRDRPKWVIGCLDKLDKAAKAAEIEKPAR